MNQIVSTRIISECILNKETGELETKDFREVKESKKIKGGFSMVYHKDYDEILKETVFSNKEMILFIWIREQFTYQRVETYITYSLAKEDGIDISKRQFSTMVKRLVENKFLKRIKRGIYRLNPYIYLPYKAEASVLQKQWNEL
jgi:hypothetical protein